MNKNTNTKAVKPPAPIPDAAEMEMRVLESGIDYDDVDEYNIAIAREVAYEAHKHQTDKSGRPYREHLLGVYRGVVVLGGSVAARQAAFLHDVVEDTPITLKDLTEQYCFEEDVVTAVEAVTKRSGEEQGAYLARIIEAGADAIAVKTADLLHNTRPDRMAGLPQHTQDRLHKKYRPALARLLLEAGRIVDEGTQAKLATKPQGSSSRSFYSSGGFGGSAYARYLRAHEIQVGDWPSAASAPVEAIDEDSKLGWVFTLENGNRAAITNRKMVPVWWAQDVEAKCAKDPEWAPPASTGAYSLQWWAEVESGTGFTARLDEVVAESSERPATQAEVTRDRAEQQRRRASEASKAAAQAQALAAAKPKAPMATVPPTPSPSSVPQV